MCICIYIYIYIYIIDNNNNNVLCVYIYIYICSTKNLDFSWFDSGRFLLAGGGFLLNKLDSPKGLDSETLGPVDSGCVDCEGSCMALGMFILSEGVEFLSP